MVERGGGGRCNVTYGTPREAMTGKVVEDSRESLASCFASWVGMCVCVLIFPFLYCAWMDGDDDTRLRKVKVQKVTGKVVAAANSQVFQRWVCCARSFVSEQDQNSQP